MLWSVNHYTNKEEKNELLQSKDYRKIYNQYVKVHDTFQMNLTKWTRAFFTALQFLKCFSLATLLTENLRCFSPVLLYIYSTYFSDQNKTKHKITTTFVKSCHSKRRWTSLSWQSLMTSCSFESGRWSRESSKTCRTGGPPDLKTMDILFFLIEDIYNHTRV